MRINEMVASVFDIQYRMEVDLNLVSIFYQFRCTSMCISVYIFRSKEWNLSYLYSCCLWSSFIFHGKAYKCRECVATATLLLLKNGGNETEKIHTTSATSIALVSARQWFSVWTIHCCCCFSLSYNILEFLESFHKRCYTAFYISPFPLHSNNLFQLAPVYNNKIQVLLLTIIIVQYSLALQQQSGFSFGIESWRCVTNLNTI